MTLHEADELICKRAVAAERERCAKIADEWTRRWTWEHNRAGSEIAARIRSGE